MNRPSVWGKVKISRGEGREMKGCHLFHSERLWEVRRDRLDLPSDRDARTFIAAKKAHQLSTRSRHVKDQNTCLQAIILIKSRATCRQNKRCKSNLSTVSVLVKRSLHQDLMHSGCRGSQMFVYRLSPFPSPLLAIFSLFPLTVWLSVLFLGGFTWIPIHASAIILFSLC